jgi:hypothetical protein
MESNPVATSPAAPTGATPPTARTTHDFEPTAAGALRTEIIDAQKQGAEMQRWKIIGSATIAALVLGLGGGKTDSTATKVHVYVLCAIPPLCLFADMICAQIAIRIAVIAGYLRSKEDDYERYVAQSAKHLAFKIEPLGSLFSTTLLCAFVALFPRVLSQRLGFPVLDNGCAWPLEGTAVFSWLLACAVAYLPRTLAPVAR